MSYAYTSSLESLVFEQLEPQPPSQINDDAMAADLDLWTNAKFTYDSAPGQGIMDDKPAPFDLAQYLDMDMATAAPPAPSTVVPSSTNTKSPNTNASTRPPTILPKPSLDLLTLPLSLLPLSLPLAGTTDLSQTSKKRLSSSSSSSSSDDFNGDDTKRRRNTAASARFRVKKKQKEQAMAQTVRDMTEKVETLQNRINELENETKWLRDLLLEKNSTKNIDQ